MLIHGATVLIVGQGNGERDSYSASNTCIFSVNQRHIEVIKFDLACMGSEAANYD